MEKQAIDFSAAIRGVVTYASSSETIERAQSARFESRKVVVDFVRMAHDQQWKTISKPIKAAIDSLAVGIVADKVGLLGVIKTCCEYSIMPTTLNADRLRKAKTWTTLEGKTVPNSYGKVHTKSGAGKKAPAQLDASKTATAATPTDADEKKANAIIAAIERQIDREDDEKMKQIGAVGNALALATMQRGAGQTAPKAPSVSATTAQKASEPVHPLTSNVSSTDAPLSAREHFKVLFNQMSKNETFRGEYCDILALMLDVEKSTLTRCMVQAADEVKV